MVRVTRWFSALRGIGFAVAALVAAGGCGAGEQPEEAKQAAAKVEDSVKKKKEQKGTGSDFVAKPEWDMIAPHFAKYMGDIQKDIHSKSVTWNYKDAFAPRLEKFYPSVPETAKVMLEPGGAGKKDTEAKKTEDKTIQSILTGIMAPAGGESAEANPELAGGPVNDPLLTESVTKYSFRIIMTGIANPEVLVEDLNGDTHIVHVNDKIGNEGGYVSDILKHRIYIKLPDKEQPIEVSLAPESLPDSFVAKPD